MEVRPNLLQDLEALLKPNKAKESLAEFSCALVRLIFSKKLSHLDWPFVKGFTTGQCTRDKYTELLRGWLTALDEEHGGGLLALAGLSAASAGSSSSLDPIEEEVFVVEPDEPLAEARAAVRPFPVGSLVKVTVRVSRPCPTRTNPGHFRDLTVGKEGRVMGYNEHDWPIVLCHVTDKGQPRDLVNPHDPAKLVLASEFGPRKDEPKAAADPRSAFVPAGQEHFLTGLEEKDYTKVTQVPWENLLQEGSDAQVRHDVKAYVSVMVDLLRREAPQYSGADFDVIHREPETGAAEKEALVEVWTKRDFQPDEILLLPATTEIKDRYWTQSKSVMVHLPRDTAT